MPMISTSAPREAGLETCSFPAEKPEASAFATKWIEIAILLLAGFFFALYFIHLKADFPNHSPWMDWAKYTDEGWYGDAAIRHYQLGHWNVPGDFNPAAALPMWPLLELALFRTTGVSLAAARALSVTVFGLSLVCCYLLVRGWTSDTGAVRRRSLAPAIAVLLLAANPFNYVFNRMAIVEPLLGLLTLLALLAASRAGASAAMADAGTDGRGRRAALRAWLPPVLLGLLLPMMVLTKTTALFLIPAVFWMLWAAAGYQRLPFLRKASVASGVGAVAWLAYFLLFVRPHFLADYRYLFSANGYTKVTLDSFETQLLGTIYAGIWFGTPLFVVALIAAVVVLISLWRSRLRSNPLAMALLLWIAGYSAFMVYHASIRSRYYLLLVTPYTLLAVSVFEPLMVRLASFGRSWKRDGGASGVNATGVRKMLLDLAGLAVTAALLVGFAEDASTTVSFVRHQEYTFVNAAKGVHDVIERERLVHPDHSRLLLSISGSDISLITGIPSICDDFGTMELSDRLAAYKPGWFATWNEVEDDKMEALAPMYRLERVAAFPAYDDPDRNLLILYRLDPLSSPGRSSRPGRRRYMNSPGRLRVKPLRRPDNAPTH
jgi:hypothetical protein